MNDYIVLDIPKRPKWSFHMSKNQVEKNEQEYFMKYLQNIHDKYSEDELSYFEHNLEVYLHLFFTNLRFKFNKVVYCIY